MIPHVGAIAAGDVCRYLFNKDVPEDRLRIKNQDVPEDRLHYKAGGRKFENSALP